MDELTDEVVSETWKVTYMNKHHSTRHEVLVEAPSHIVAQRVAWDAFTQQRVSQRYGAPVWEDFFIYSVVRDAASVPQSDSRDT
jgi:hypothetical protein